MQTFNAIMVSFNNSFQRTPQAAMQTWAMDIRTMVCKNWFYISITCFHKPPKNNATNNLSVCNEVYNVFVNFGLS